MRSAIFRDSYACPPGVFSTCSNRRLVDYSVTHECEHEILDDIKLIQDNVITPHSPVAAVINEAMYRTQVLQQSAAPKRPQGEKVPEAFTWEEAQQVLLDMKRKIPETRYQDAEQEYHVQQLGWHTAGMQMADLYSMSYATTVIQLMSVHTRDTKEYAKHFKIGQRARYLWEKTPQ